MTDINLGVCVTQNHVNVNQNKVEEEAPEIIQRIVEFFNFWNNPDGEKGQYISIKDFQIRVYFVSDDFVFKWYVTKEELKQVSDFTEFPIIDDTIALSFSEYFFELAVRPE